MSLMLSSCVHYGLAADAQWCAHAAHQIYLRIFKKQKEVSHHFKARSSFELFKSLEFLFNPSTPLEAFQALEVLSQLLSKPSKPLQLALVSFLEVQEGVDSKEMAFWRR